MRWEKQGAFALAWLLVACVDPQEATTACGAVAVERPVFVLESDLTTTSTVARLDTNGCLTEVPGGAALSGDTVLASSHGRLFVVDRQAGQIDEIDPTALSIARSFSARSANDDESPNPHDVAVDDEGRLWITRYDRASLGVVGADGTLLHEVDLQDFADEGDLLPEMEATIVVDGIAYVTLERLADHGYDLTTRPRGLIVAIDANRLTTSSIDLVGTNPFGRLRIDGSDPNGATVTVVTPGSFDEKDEGDGIDRVDLAAPSVKTLIGEAALGGSAIEALVVGSDEAYAIVALPVPQQNPTRLVRFDPSSGKVTQILAEAEAFDYAGLVVVGSVVLIGDRSRSHPRLRFFDRDAGAEIGSLDVHAGAPFALTLLE
jgi:hypothetical protein